jgi:hypothetical protein
MFTRASYWMVIQLRRNTLLSETNILILSSHMHLVVPSDLFPTRSRIHFSCAFLSSVHTPYPIYPILYDLITTGAIMLDAGYKS